MSQTQLLFVRSAARAILVEDGRILLVRLRDQRGDWYTFPGGGQRPGETLAQTVVRECWEEIGCRVEVGPLRFIRDYIGRNHQFADAESHVHQVDHIFECRLPAGVRPGEGAEPDTAQLDVRWIPLDELARHRVFPSKVVECLIEGGSDPYLGDVN